MSKVEKYRNSFRIKIRFDAGVPSYKKPWSCSLTRRWWGWSYTWEAVTEAELKRWIREKVASLVDSKFHSVTKKMTSGDL